MYKTPNFDTALDAILKDLKPHQRQCRQCQNTFQIYDEDIDFYKMLRVPAPTLCPECRMQRRLAYRSSFWPIFYKRTCQAPGHLEKIIAFYSEKNPVKVYDDKYYLSDAWDPFSFGREYDSSRPFFEQWQELASAVPHQSLHKDPVSIDCDYVVSGVSAKNCYYVAAPVFSENIYYGSLPFHSKDSVDVVQFDYSESCYSGVYLDRCYNCAFCYESSNCLDGYFLYDCKNCSHCFGCTNLRNKNYCFFNQQLTKEEYQKEFAKINLGKRSVVKKYQTEFEKTLASAVRKNLNNVKTENSIGNDLKECKNCFYSFRILKGSENIRYTAYGDKSQDVMDCFGVISSLVYESTGVPDASKVRFSRLIRGGLEVEYSVECNNCEYIFGCFGLRNKKYCIFNKQYGEEEYWRRVDELKTAMLARGEYGEFFPIAMSPHPYLDSNAQIEFPLNKEEILKNGWHYEETEKVEVDLKGLSVLKIEEVPDDISDVSDDILNKAIICEKTGKPFRITKFELDFYRNKKLPIPVIHPLERIKDLFLTWRHPFKLWKTICVKCGKEIWSGYDPSRQLKVYCETCYTAEVV